MTLTRLCVRLSVIPSVLAGPRSAVGPGYPVWPFTFVSQSADSRGAVVSYVKVCRRSTGQPLRRSKPAQEKCG